MTDHDDVLDRIDAVIRDAEIDELVDWQLGHASSARINRPLRMHRWMPGLPFPRPRSSAGAWMVDQLREADRIVQRLRKRGRL